MRILCWAAAAVTVSTVASVALAAEVQSGIKVGGSIPTYSTTKYAGIDDGVTVGDTLCYT